LESDEPSIIRVNDQRLFFVWAGKCGRSPKYSEAAIQFCLTIKGLFNLPLRQVMGDGDGAQPAQAGLDWQVTDFSTVDATTLEIRAIEVTGNATVRSPNCRCVP
jgi:hypothetical protein